jgi:undecaprenyl-diphosphatase
MIDWLIELDQKMFLALNGAGHPHLDSLMLFLSAKLVWIPLYLLLIFGLYKHFGMDFWKPFLLVILAVACADLLTSWLMKPYFARLRPCREPMLDGLVTLVGSCGGKFGFASSHAANTFALAVFFLGHLRNKWTWYLLGWAVLVSYSRIYLGVHYPGDVLTGALIGGVFGWVASRFSRWTTRVNSI